MNSDEAFMSDVTATAVGALVGTSTTTTYIESAVPESRKAERLDWSPPQWVS